MYQLYIFPLTGLCTSSQFGAVFCGQVEVCVCRGSFLIPLGIPDNVMCDSLYILQTRYEMMECYEMMELWNDGMLRNDETTNNTSDFATVLLNKGFMTSITDKQQKEEGK